MTPKQLLKDLRIYGGTIVNAEECSELEIADAGASGRMAIDSQGYCFIRRLSIEIDNKQGMVKEVRSIAKSHCQAGIDIDKLMKWTLVLILLLLM